MKSPQSGTNAYAEPPSNGSLQAQKEIIYFSNKEN